MRSWRHWLVPGALALGACSVYTGDMLNADGYGNDDDDTSGSGSGGAQAGSTGKSNGTSGKGGTNSLAGNPGSMSDGGAEPDDEPSAGQPGGGSGGSTGGSESGGSGGSGGGGTGGAPVTQPPNLIDGFEDKNLTLARASGRDGVWYLFDDGTDGTVGPKPLVCSPLSAAPAALGGYAMHITATGFTDFGSGLGADFRDGKKVYNASEYSGIRFWARVGEGTNTDHRLALFDGTTDALGGKCNPAATAPNGEKCNDHFGVDQTFTTTWTEYSVPFASMSQSPSGWGYAAPALDATTLYGLQITAKAELEVDLWVDELEFF